MKRKILLAFVVGLLAAPHAWAADEAGASFMERWDINNDGEVSVEEAEKRRQALFAKLDANKDGYLDSNEFLAAGQEQSEPAETTILRGLDLNDINGDGKVSAGEFMANSGSWVDMMDGNNDGVVTIEEFQTKWHDRDARIRLRGG